MLINITQEIIDSAGRGSTDCVVYHAIRAHFPDKNDDGNYKIKIGAGFRTVSVDNKYYTVSDFVTSKIHDHIIGLKISPFSFELDL